MEEEEEAISEPGNDKQITPLPLFLPRFFPLSSRLVGSWLVLFSPAEKGVVEREEMRREERPHQTLLAGEKCSSA